jgi:hypothetical protein
MKKDTFYFSHDFNAHNDVKILFLRQQLGMEGYGIYWFLIESLADAGGIMPMKIIPVLAMQMHTSEVKVQAVINNFELFIIEDEFFFSNRLNDHLNKRKELSIKNSEKGKLSAEKRNSTAVQPQLNISSTKESKRKESKGKEIKLNESIELPFNNIDFINKWNEWKEYKKTQHKFTFKSNATEKISLNQLENLSNKNSEIAIKIINQSIANGWKGFFEIKNVTNDKPANEKRFDAYIEFANRYKKPSAD